MKDYKLICEKQKELIAKLDAELEGKYGQIRGYHRLRTDIFDLAELAQLESEPDSDLAERPDLNCEDEEFLNDLGEQEDIIEKLKDRAILFWNNWDISKKYNKDTITTPRVFDLMAMFAYANTHIEKESEPTERKTAEVVYKILEDRSFYFEKHHHGYEAKEMKRAIEMIKRLVPPSDFNVIDFASQSLPEIKRYKWTKYGLEPDIRGEWVLYKEIFDK